MYPRHPALALCSSTTLQASGLAGVKAGAGGVQGSTTARLWGARRIAIVGSPGAGKSPLALQLGALLGRPVLHLDRLYWRPGWVEVAQDVFDAQLEGLVGRNEWIIDGNYSRTLDIRLRRADAAIMLDFSRTLCLYRA